MTSAISPPRRLLALCSPRIHLTASTTLLFPDPLGPTTAVSPGGKVNHVRSAKLLNPTNSSRLSIRRPHGRGGDHQPWSAAIEADGRRHGNPKPALTLSAHRSFASRTDCRPRPPRSRPGGRTLAAFAGLRGRPRPAA